MPYEKEYQEPKPLLFASTWEECQEYRTHNYLLHILCVGGRGRLSYYAQEYEVQEGDYFIFPDGDKAVRIGDKGDLALIVMAFDYTFYQQNATRSNYDAVGSIALMDKPLMRLSREDYNKCRVDLLRLRERSQETGHLFADELLGTLLRAHILDVYDIHARTNTWVMTSSRPAALMRHFVQILLQGDYIRYRTLGYYADKLHITPHYLSDICKELTGMPASYWIDRFLLREATRLIAQPQLSLEEIAFRLNFSSASYLSRYIRVRLGMSPSDFRNSLGKRQ